MKSRKTLWSVKYQPTDDSMVALSEISQSLGISDICASLLYIRGYTTAQTAQSFLNSTDLLMHSPLLLKDVYRAVDRIADALKKHERIAIYGDYDVDGVTSVTMLYLYLKELGADVGYYIPNRMDEGYGLSNKAISHLASLGVKLIITVDTGITATEEVKYATSLGIDTVVTDHHECQDELPDAIAVVNPHRADCPYPFKQLAGVGVIFKVITAYEILEVKGRDREKEAVSSIYRRFADLAAIGTVADVMPIVDENRIIVKYGIAMLEHTERLGISALMEAASIGGNPNVRPAVGDRPKPTRPRRINSSYIGFTLAPRINAAGRIASASEAVELLLSDNEDSAELLAQQLCETNYQRQLEENRIAQSAYEMIENDFDPDCRVIVVASDEWLGGVIGIVSSKVTEKYGLPSILVSFKDSFDGDPDGLDIGKGSGRSIKGFNLVDALSHSREYLVKFGGHELAAGLSVRRKDLDKFRNAINEYARTVLSDDDLCRHIEADREVSLSELDMKLAREITLLEPFGTMNPAPNFIMNELRVLRIYSIGGGSHTKLVLEQNGRSVDAVMFHRSSLQLGIHENDLVDVLFSLEINRYNNVESIQLILQDIRRSERFVSYFKDERALYARVSEGAEFSAEDALIPTRDDFAVLYSLLRREFSTGNDVMTDEDLVNMLSRVKGCNIRLAKLKLMLDILNELELCTVSELSTGLYRYEICKRSEKADIESSEILKKLKRQCT